MVQHELIDRSRQPHTGAIDLDSAKINIEYLDADLFGTTPPNKMPTTTANYLDLNQYSQPQHATEWAQLSGIDLDLIGLNLRSIEQAEAFSFLVPNPERRNDGRLTDRHLRTFNRLEAGGWICQGVEPLSMNLSNWGCLKPDRPRWDETKRKHIKYEHPHGIPTELFCLRVTYRIGLKIAKNNGLEAETSYLARMVDVEPSDEDRQFWQWVKDNPHISIVLTEGAKKAASLLSHGYCAIALPGIYNGYRSKINGVPCVEFLIPQLEVFTQKDREIAFCFDRDLKPKTIREVRKALDRTGKLLKRKGCRVSVVTWNYPYKGVDDLIVGVGAEAFEQSYIERSSLEEWRLAGTFTLSRYLAHSVNSRYLDPTIGPAQPEGKIIAVKSAKGTGKTEWLAERVRPFIDSGRGVLILTHRIQLAKALAQRLGVSHIEAVKTDGGLFGYALCIDSLHPNSQAKFTPAAWDGAAIVIDEVEQVIWHLLNSNTCRSQRGAILETFEQLLRNVAETNGTIYLADADLSGVSIEYIRKLTDNRMELWLLVNDFILSNERRNLTTYGNEATLISEAIAAVKRGENIIIHCSSQRQKSKWTAQHIERLFRDEIPDLKILAIDSETVADRCHPAYGCIERINEVVTDYQVVIATPTIETGISIDGNHFDSVWCLANGVQTVDSVCQTIERVRADVPRHLCISASACSRVGNGGTDIKYLLSSEHQQFKATYRTLSILDRIADEDGYNSNHLDTWASYAAKVNLGFKNYRQNIINKLIQEGYQVEEYQSRLNDESISITQIKQAIEDIRDRDYEEHRIEIVAADNPHDIEFQKLKKQRPTTKEERLKLAKGDLCRRYQTEDITDAIILKDDRGWYPQIQLHYYLTLGREFLEARDRRKLETVNANGRSLKTDVNRSTLVLKVKTLELLNIAQFFGEDKTFTAGDLTEWFGLVVRLRSDIKTVLGCAISPDSTPIQAAQQLLGAIGLRLTYIDRIRIDGIPTRRYAGVECDFDNRFEVFDRWLTAETAKRSTPSNNIYNPEQGSSLALQEAA